MIMIITEIILIIQKCINWITILTLSVFLVCATASNSLSKDSRYIPDKSTRKNMVSSYLKYNQTTDAYLIDLLVNGNHHGPKMTNHKDSGIYFYYEAQEYLDKYSNIKSPLQLDKALQSIDKAIQKDPIALNFFLKSYLLFKKGDTIKSDKVFMEGINKPYNCTYTTRGSEAFVRMISASCDANAYNVFLFMSNIYQLEINSGFYVFTIKKLVPLLSDPSFPSVDRKEIICGMTNIINANNKAFYLLQYNIINITNFHFKKLYKDDISNTCSLKYNPDAIKEPDDINASGDKFTKSDDLRDLEKALFWRNFESIATTLKVRK